MCGGRGATWRRRVARFAVLASPNAEDLEVLFLAALWGS